MAVRHEIVFVTLDGLATVLADPPPEALGEDELQRRGQQERLHAHVDQARHGRRAVVGVEGGEDEVAGEGGPDGDLGRLEVARLAH